MRTLALFLALALLSGCAGLLPAKAPMASSGQANCPVLFGLRADGKVEMEIHRFCREAVEEQLRRDLLKAPIPADPGRRAF